MEKYIIANSNRVGGDIQKDKNFGIDNNFPELNATDSRKQDILFNRRDLIIGRYNALCRHLLLLIDEEESLWKSFQEISDSICELEGHRLSTSVDKEITSDEFGNPQTKYFRTCLVCGKRVYKEDLQENDVVIKGEPRLQRVLYHK